MVIVDIIIGTAFHNGKNLGQQIAFEEMPRVGEYIVTPTRGEQPVIAVRHPPTSATTPEKASPALLLKAW